MKLRVQVKPRSTRPGVEAAADGSLVVRVASPPVEGRANREACELVAEHLGVAKSKVKVLGGAKSRNKVIEVAS